MDQAGSAPSETGTAGRELEDRVNSLEQQFSRLYNSYRQRMRERASALDPALQPSGFRTLLELVIGGPTGAGTLSDVLGFDKSVLSRQLAHLEGLGLVSRDQDPADRRTVIIRATPSAIERMRRIRRGAHDEFRLRLTSWSEHDLDELARLLARL